jgi:hypothetical protein
MIAELKMWQVRCNGCGRSAGRPRENPEDAARHAEHAGWEGHYDEEWLQVDLCPECLDREPEDGGEDAREGVSMARRVTLYRVECSDCGRSAGEPTEYEPAAERHAYGQGWVCYCARPGTEETLAVYHWCCPECWACRLEEASGGEGKA